MNFNHLRASGIFFALVRLRIFDRPSAWTPSRWTGVVLRGFLCGPCRGLGVVGRRTRTPGPDSACPSPEHQAAISLDRRRVSLSSRWLSAVMG